MKFFVGGTLRFIAVLAVFLLLFHLHGGQVGIFWKPTGMLYTLAVNLFSIQWLIGLKEISTNKDGEKVLAAGRLALALGSLVIISGGILTLGIIDLEPHVIGHSVAAVLVESTYLLLAYVCFYVPHYYLIKADKISESAELPTILRKHGHGLLIVMGILTTAALAIGGSFEIYSKYFNQNTPKEVEAYTETQRRVASEAEAYATANCKVMPEEEQTKRYWEIEKEEYQKRGLNK